MLEEVKESPFKVFGDQVRAFLFRKLLKQPVIKTVTDLKGVL
jgi:hypothetical protein